MANFPLQADSACATYVSQVCVANDNSPSREFLRLKIILDWWERELRSIIQSRPHSHVPQVCAWRERMAEAQAKVTNLRRRVQEAV